eukprot:747686-Hanusia_phi.AAC.1
MDEVTFPPVRGMVPYVPPPSQIAVDSKSHQVEIPHPLSCPCSAWARRPARGAPSPAYGTVAGARPPTDVTRST